MRIIGLRRARVALVLGAKSALTQDQRSPGHGGDPAAPVFRPVANNRTKELNRPLDPDSVYHNVVRKYGHATGIDAQVNGLCVHSLRATAAINALDNKADSAKVQEWLGHANVSTTRLYDREKRGLKIVRHLG